MKTPFNGKIKNVGVIAPAGKADGAKIAASLALFNQWGIGVKFFGESAGTDKERPYLAAGTECRIDAIHRAWRDEDIDLLFCVRGGFGSVHLLDLLDWRLLRSRNLMLIGYSDITALHLAMLRKKAGTPVAAPMFANFATLMGNSYSHQCFSRLFTDDDDNPTALEMPAEYGELNFIRRKDVSSLPVVANLAVMASLCGTDYMVNLTNRILIIEDINEPPYKIDRYLTQLTQNGIFKQTSALIFGQFENCGEKSTLDSLFEQAANEVNGAVISNFPFGHGQAICSINQAKPITISGDNIFI